LRLPIAECRLNWRLAIGDSRLETGDWQLIEFRLKCALVSSGNSALALGNDQSIFKRSPINSAIANRQFKSPIGNRQSAVIADYQSE
jgi:hypothetical protein